MGGSATDQVIAGDEHGHDATVDLISTGAGSDYVDALGSRDGQGGPGLGQRRLQVRSDRSSACECVRNAADRRGAALAGTVVASRYVRESH